MSGDAATGLSARSQGWGAVPIAPTHNQSYSVTPSDSATVTAGAANNGDQRQYKVTGLADGTKVRVELFNAKNVKTDSNGQVSFADAENNGAGNDKADTGSVSSVITVVNGTTVNGGNGQQAVDVAASNGSVTFTVKGQGYESAVPVVYDNSTDPDALDLNANNMPTEAFGIGGTLNVVPAEASTGQDISGKIIGVNKDQNYIVLDNNGSTAGGQFVVYYGRTGDSYYVDQKGANSASEPAVTDRTSESTFENDLTIGDSLESSSVYSKSFGSTFVLDNEQPAAPTIGSATPSDTSVTFTVTGVTDGATVNIYGAKEPATGTVAFDQTSKLASSSTDADSKTAGFQIKVSGLSAQTKYDFYATQTVSGEESPASSEDTETTLAANQVAQLVSDNAVATKANDLLGNTAAADQWQIGFNRVLNSTDLAGAKIAVQDANGNQAVVANGGGNTFTTNTVKENFQGTTYAPGELLTVTLGAPVTSGSGSSAKTLSYPLTVINESGVDAGSNYGWDLADSTDKKLEVNNSAGATPTDQTNPVVTEKATTGATTAGDIDVTGTATDADSGLKTVTYAVYDSTGAAVSGKSGTVTPNSAGAYSFTVSGLTTGATYTVKVTATDNAGNSTTTSSSAAAK